VSQPTFESASGLRPAAAFLMIAAVLVAVLVKAWSIAHEDEHLQPVRASEETLPRPDFDLADREGRTLALSVQRMDLCLSPNSMWQAHTPRRIAERILPFLESDLTVEDLLALLIPDAKDGVIEVVDEDWKLGFDEAERIQRWIRDQGLQEGFELRRLEGGPHWHLHWRPERVLAEETRPRRGGGDEPIFPLSWSRRLADGLTEARWPELAPETARVEPDELEERRRRIWRALLPCGETTAIRRLPTKGVAGLIAALDEEGVQGHQMRVEYRHERRYPVRGGYGERAVAGAGEDEPEHVEHGAFRVLGHWRFLASEEETAPIAALRRPDATEAELATLARRLLDVRHPSTGLEGLAGRLLADPSWRFVEPESASYRFRRDWPVHQPARRYFFDDSLEDATPRVYCTIAAELQAYLHEELESAIDEHRPAVAMGIAVDVASGQVLAVDGISPYDVAEFIPTWHLFTPGSTFKVIVMTTALDQGKVEPDDPFNTFDGNYRIPSSRRVIHEAKGAPKGWITATQALSRSVNAVMVQIGLLVDDDVFHEKLTALHYGEPPLAGVGVERAGSIPELPWKPAWSHASVSFGHEVELSLWQHAAALSTVLRGGEYLPLSMLLGVEWDGDYYALEEPRPERVFSRSAGAATRRMMEEGALSGTGKRLLDPERAAGSTIVFASKTGTTEKKPTEPCLHLELERNRDNAKLERGREDPRFVTFEDMMARMHREGRPHPRACYTSSICLAGKLPDSDREVMVLVVVEEPCGDGKFGSDVAGPTALRVLKEALGLTRQGVPVRRLAEYHPDYGYENEWNEDDAPWAHRVEEERW